MVVGKLKNDISRQAYEIAALVKKKELSARQVAEMHLDWIEKTNPEVNAIADEMSEEALKSADLVDTQIARGEDPGPLAGVPVTVKVNADQVGRPTTNGITLQRDLIADSDSPLVANIRRAGGVIVGRTNTPAFSMRWFTNNNLHGQTLNPRNVALTPGGSSGGAAAAVAAGMCAVAHGTDIAGSIRYPAYACGVHGLRPSHGRVPVRNATGADRMIGAQLMSVSGPIARSIIDLKLAHNVMCRADVQDPWCVDMPIEDARYAKRAALTLAPDGMEVETSIKESLRDAAKALEARGWEIEEVACPPIREAADINATLWMAEMELGAAELIEREAEPDSQFVFAHMKRLAGPLDLEAVMQALQSRTALMRTWEQFLQRYPVLICPVSGELPFEQQSDVRSQSDFERIYEAQLTQRGLPVIGIPALAVATGYTGANPIGVQLVSARFREDILFDAGAIIEAASPQVEVATL